MLKILCDYADDMLLLIFLAGIFLIIDNDIKIFLSRMRLRRELKLKELNIQKTGRLEHHITGLLDMLPDAGRGRNAADFIRRSVMTAAAVFIVTSLGAGFPAGVAAAAVVMLLPYMLLRMRCEKIRAAVNDECEKLLSTILSAYRINNFNIEKAIEHAAGQSAEIPRTSAILSTMLLRMRECGDEEDVRRVTEGFAEAVGSSWARLLAVNIRMAYVDGRDIHITLEEQLRQIKESKQLMQERLRSNNESMRMITYMIPAAMAITCVLAVGQMGMTPAELVKAQFGDSTACILMLLIVLFFIFNIGISKVVLMKKTDI